MNYNDYDSNGNEKRFSVDFSDNQQRSRMILLVYALIFVVLVIVIRTSSVELQSNTNSVTNTANTAEPTNTIDDQPNNNNELKESFSMLDANNYSFSIKLQYEGKVYTSTGKKYGNKVYVEHTMEGVVYKYMGSFGDMYIYNPSTNAYVQSNLPYFYINYFDHNVIKRVLLASQLVDDKYQISNKDLSKISEHDITSPKDEYNYITLTKKNNIIVGVTMDITNVVNNTLDKNTETKVTIEYGDFGLIEDFALENN